MTLISVVSIFLIFAFLVYARLVASVRRFVVVVIACAWLRFVLHVLNSCSALQQARARFEAVVFGSSGCGMRVLTFVIMLFRLGATCACSHNTCDVFGHDGCIV